MQLSHLIQSSKDKIFFQINTSQIFLIIISIVIGILASYGALFFRYLISIVIDIYSSTNGFIGFEWWQRLLYPTSGGLIVGIIVSKFAPEVKGSGIPEVIKSISLHGGIIRFRVLITKAIAAAVTIGSGGSVGREGPIVHIGSAIGSTIGQLIGVSSKNLRTLVACGAASAISATFNAPFAGAMFALEVIMGKMTVVSMPPVIISSVIASVNSRHYLDNFSEFYIPDCYIIYPVEFIFFAILGVLSSIVAIVFITCFLKVSVFFDKINIPLWIKPAIGGLIVGIIGLYVPNIIGVGYHTINDSLWNKLDLNLLIIVIFAKLLATTFSLGSGASGGVFAPSLFMGATLGAAWGKMMLYFFPDTITTTSTYALIGMGSVVSAVTHAPISAILIIFELTNSFDIITPLMLSCIISLIITNRMIKKSIYLAKLESGGIKIESNQEINLLRDIKVIEIIDNDPVLIHASTPFPKVLSILFFGKTPSAVVLGDKNQYIGMLCLNEIRKSLPDSEDLSDIVIAHDVANTTVPFVTSSDHLDFVMQIFGKIDIDEIAVCDNAINKVVIGIVTRKSIISLYNSRVFQEDLSGSFVSVIDSIKEGRIIEVFSGMYITEIDVPYSWIGKTIWEIELRKKYGLQAIAVNRIISLHKTTGIEPKPELKILKNDKLLVIGNKASISKMSFSLG